MAAKVASLLIDVAADIAKIRKDFDDAGKVVGDFGRKIEAIGKALAGIFAARAVINFGESIAKQLDDMADAAENLKIPFEEFQALTNAAYLAGQSVEGTTNAFAKFNQFMGKAEGGAKEQIELLQELGLTINNLDGSAKSTSQRLQEAALAITSIQNPARRSAIEMEVFGKSGQRVSAILEQWKRPLEDINRELEEQGLVHAPAVAKSLADMADQSDKAAQKMAVLFAIVYAPIKSTAFEWMAGVFERIGKSLIAMQGSDNVLAKLAELMNAFTGGGIEAAANAVTGGDTTALTRMSQEVTRLEEAIVATRQTMRSLEESGQASTSQYAEQVMQVGRLEAALKRAYDAQRKLVGMAGGVVVTGTRPPGTNPPVKGPATPDKYQEALRKIANETEALTEAQKAYNYAASSGLPTAAAERLAKHLEGIAKKQNELGKGLTTEQADDIDKRVEALAKLQFAFSEVQRIQREGDAISRQYGDGQKQLLDTLYQLNEARAAGVITEAEYAAAVEDANEKQAEQALLAQKNIEGIEGLAAGWEYAAMKMSQSTNSFATGQQLFTATVNLMSDAIMEFAQTGEINFGKLAAAFAKMLAEMALQMAIHAGLKAILGAMGGGVSPITKVGSTPLALEGGARQHGGPVMPPYGYTVGELGPERFVPTIPGRIEPANSNDGGGAVSVNVDMRGTESAQGANAGQAMDFGRRVRAAVVDVIANEKRPGGSLYRR